MGPILMNCTLFDVTDMVVLVSGGSRGIGLSIAGCFAARGAKVIVTGRSGEALARACESVSATHGAMGYRVCDVGHEEMIEACVRDVGAEYGRIDTLVNCAGVNYRRQAVDFDVADFDQIMQTNLRGTFLMSQYVGRKMIAQGSGSQINIDSLSTHAPLDRIVPYAMSKSAMSSMTKGLAHEWGRYGVRVNGLAPGFIVTDLNEDLWADRRMRTWNDTMTPLQRLGTPDDLIAAAIFLASPGASFVTGQTIRVDGGLSAGMSWPLSGDPEGLEKGSSI